MFDENIKTIILFCVIGFFVVGFIGTISHFFYSWSDKNKIIGILFPVNESTWEHLKLAILPTILYFFFGLFFIQNPNYLFAFFIVLLTPIILIPIIFYSYTAITKSSILIIDILSFYFALFVAFLLCFDILTASKVYNIFNLISIIGIVIIVISYLTFTLYPPKYFLFKDPISGGYGFENL